MKFFLLCLLSVFLAACASETAPDSPENPAQTKADIKTREDFARNLPKPPER
jgi:hypothetical protein